MCAVMRTPPLWSSAWVEVREPVASVATPKRAVGQVLSVTGLVVEILPARTVKIRKSESGVELAIRAPKSLNNMPSSRHGQHELER
jgi:hypothetical protein